MKIPAWEGVAKEDNDAIEALSDEEQRVFSALQQWGEILMPTDNSASRTRKSKKRSKAAKVDLDEVALRLIDSITTTLGELRGEVQRSDTEPVNQ